MDFLLAVFCFLGGLVFSLVRGWSMAYPLLAGLVLFSLTAMHRGFSFPDVLKVILSGMVRIRIILPILFLIGILMGAWRACGTVAFFVYYGVSVLTPQFFVFFVFLLSSIVSFVLGSSLGTVGTVGVVLMLLARASGVNPAVTAGAAMAGACFGDRCSPVSACASLVAAVTETSLHDNIPAMLKSAFFPFLGTLAAYGAVSLAYPMNVVDSALLSEIPKMFSLTWPTLLPAAIILVLAVFRVGVVLSITLSILVASVVAVSVQGLSYSEVIRALFMGYAPHQTGTLAGLIAGGGLFSIADSIVIVLLASSFSGIFDGARLLEEPKAFLSRLSKKWSLYQTTLATGTLAASFACNQPLAIVLTQQLVGPLYGDRKSQLALDLADSVSQLSNFIPWNIGFLVPLSMLSADSDALLWLFYPLALPLGRLLGEWRKRNEKQAPGF